MNVSKALIIAAHPDDDILGCGGYLSKHKGEKEIRVAFIAEGTTCRFKPKEIDGEIAQQAIKSRTESSIQSLDLLGVHDTVFYDLPCGRLDQEPILEINQIIEAEIGSFQPQLVLTHAEHDVNNDHRIVYRSVQMATRPGGLCHAPSLMSFEVLSSTEWNYSSVFDPNYFELLNKKDVQRKWEALACFESEIREFPHPRSKLGVETLARYRGMQSSMEYAEAYKIIRNLEK